MSALETVGAVEPWLVSSGGAKNFLLVRIRSQSGAEGWGEVYTVAGREKAQLQLLEELGRHLIGRPVWEIRAFAYTAYADFAIKRGSMEFWCALSGLEIALWDLNARLVGRPVHALLGGMMTPDLPLYANGWLRKFDGSPAAIEAGVARAMALKEQGFEAFKFDPFPGAWRPTISSADLAAAVTCVKELRRALGPEARLLIECHRRFSAATAVHVGEQMRPFDPFWYEEPVPSAYPTQLSDVRKAVRLPIVSGEDLYTKEAFVPLIAAGSADIFNPDLCCCGGFLPLLEIAALAETALISVAPHNYNSPTIGFIATAHASAVLRNFVILEYFVNFQEFLTEVMPEEVAARPGHYRVGSAPGLGATPDLKALERRRLI